MEQINKNPINNDINKKRLSESITCMRFPLAVIIIAYHSYTIVSIPEHSIYFNVLYPFSLWIGQTGVPAFFFISGLWFYYSSKPYKEKIHRRITTLVTPYILWNAIMLTAFIIAYLAGYKLIINQIKGIEEYGILDYIRAFWDCGDWAYGNGKPVYPPMWFIRDLFLLCLISPIIKIIIKRTGFLLPLFIFIVWLLTPGFWLSIEAVFSFCLGAYFPLHNINLLSFLEKKKIIVFFTFIILGVSDIVTNTIWPVPYNLQIHRLAIVSNILFIPLLGSFLVGHNIHLTKLSKMTFFIYCIHLPIVAMLRKPVILFPYLSDTVHIFLYFISIICVTCITIGIYIFTKKHMPFFFRIATGNKE